MKTYKIIAKVDNEERRSAWSGYTEEIAIAQFFLCEAQQGARHIEILEVTDRL